MGVPWCLARHDRMRSRSPADGHVRKMYIPGLVVVVVGGVGVLVQNMVKANEGKKVQVHVKVPQ